MPSEGMPNWFMEYADRRWGVLELGTTVPLQAHGISDLSMGCGLRLYRFVKRTPSRLSLAA
jgi:hypothetical protein